MGERDTPGTTGDEATTASARPPGGAGGRAVTLDAPSSPGPLPTDLGAAATASPEQAMVLEEVARYRVMAKLMRWLAVALLAALPVFDGDPVIEKVFAACLLLGFPLGWQFERRLRDPATFRFRDATLTAFGLSINFYLGVLYFGVFSAALAIPVLGLYFFCRIGSRRAALAVYLWVVALHVAVAAPIAAGWVADPGVLPVPQLALVHHLLLMALAQFMYFLAFWLARSTRRSTLEAMTALEQARLRVVQREALLAEAREDLDAALAVAGPGRYSEQTVGSFVLGDVIGRGAMGEVYAAARAGGGEPAAVKLLHVHLLEDPHQVARFLREAQAASALRSPHVVRVLEVSAPLAPLPYLAMERVSGRNLADLLRERQVLPPPEVIDLVEQVGGVVDALRDKQIVHRDLKPQNLVLAERRHGVAVWKVLDFGVASLSSTSGTLTQGRVIGTPGYMAPEQAGGHPVDHRADLYALAAIAYRCLTGRPAFSGRDIPAMLYRVVHAMPPRPGATAALPQDVDRVLAIGLAKRREDRFDSGGELASALAAAVAGELSAAYRARADALLAELPWEASRRRAASEAATAG